VANPNPFARFSHRARLRAAKRLAVTCLASANNGLLVDFGCGNGRFLSELNDHFQDREKRRVTLYGYDPFMSSQFVGYSIVSDPTQIADNSADMITCLEVCEHLDTKELANFIHFAKRKLKAGGFLLVTVPIMLGPVVLFKELSRMLLFRRWTDTAFADLLKASVFYIAPPRADNIKTSHRGYDWRVTYRSLAATFKGAQLTYTPLPLLRYFFNSQVLMLFRQS
jgi:SAM-dependent methyltransferase